MVGDLSIFNLFKKQEDYTDFVDLTIGRVYIKPLNNGIINKVTSRSTIYGSVLNNSFYFSMMEYELVVLKPKQIDGLSIKDGEKLRSKIKEILTRHGLITVEVKPTKTDFTETDQLEFKKQEMELINRLRAKNG